MRKASLLLLCVAATVRATDPAPKPIRCMAERAAGARGCFDRTTSRTQLAKALVGTRIVFGDDVKAGDRYAERGTR